MSTNKKKCDEIYEGIDITIRVPKMWIEFLVDYHEWSGYEGKKAEEVTAEYVQEELARALQGEIRDILKKLGREFPMIYDRFSKKYPRLARSVNGRLRLIREGYAKIDFE